MDDKKENSEAENNRQEALSWFRELGGGEAEGVPVDRLFHILDENGINKVDPRLKDCLRPFLEGSKKYINKKEFVQLFQQDSSKVLRKSLRREFIIPDFADFKQDVENIFEEVKSNTGGEMNPVLPHPAPERQPAFAVSICTVDGQLLQLGDHDLAFLLQSISKPINYAIAYEEVGKKKVHQHVGVEPGSESFEASMMLNEQGLPHNAMLTSGAMMVCSLIKPDLKEEERLDHVMQVWEKMIGNRKVSYNHESFLNERKNSDRHFSLAYLMREKRAFPEGVDLGRVIEYYLKCCAIEVNIDDLAHAAATLANYGQCPSTGTKVFQHDTVRDTLSLMLSSGMYDHSGQFAYEVGIPAKSGIAGGVMVVIPELMGISVYSPPLDVHSNSVRGVEFCEKLVEKFNFHKYDAIGMDIHGKKDPRKGS